MLKGEIQRNEDGSPVYVPTEDEFEHLRTLQQNPAWHIYRKILIQLKEGYFHSTLPMIETNQIVKTIGMVTGLNLSVNMLDAMVQMKDKKKKKSGEPEN